MPFKKGDPKPPNSGRKPSEDSKRIAGLAITAMQKHGCDPIEGMVLIAMNKENPAGLRGRMFSELAQYIHPKRRAIEMSGPEGAAVELNINIREQILSRIAGLAARRREGSGS